MNVRNLLKPGEYVYPIPVGALLTLQYNVNGNLEKVYSGLDDDRVDRTSELMIQMLNNKTVPAKLKIAGGTSLVLGVLYTGNIPTESADSKEFQESIIAGYKKKADAYNFFAFSIDCTASRISGALSNQSTLAMNGFQHLTAVIVPANPTDMVVRDWLSNNYWKYIQNVCMGFYKLSSTPEFVPVDFRAAVVESIDKTVSETGAIMAIIRCIGGMVLSVDYSEIILKNIHPKDFFFADYNNAIAFVSHSSAKPVSNWMTCDCCGRRFTVSGAGEVHCPDSSCMSNKYPALQRFLMAFGLPTMNYADYINNVASGNLTSIPDILLMEPYKDAEIQTSISKILRALVPVRLIPRGEIFTLIENGVMNKVKTLIFYIDHPDKIGSDLGIHHPDLNRFIVWASDGGNVSDLKTILLSKQIKITNENRAFDGAPILRNKKICITGLFIHGDYADIIGILRSYAAEATTALSADCDCVLVGDTGEEIDGQVLKEAKRLNIPIFYEVAFFKHYEIDSDLQTLYSK